MILATIPWARCREYEAALKHPERTAKRSGTGMNFDVTYQQWTNRKAMARTIRMQQKRAACVTDWKAVVPLTDGEGY